MNERNPFAPKRDWFEPEYREVYDAAMEEVRAIVEQHATEFRATISQQLEQFLSVDLAAEYQKEIDKERQAMNAEFAELRSAVSALNEKFREDLEANAVDVEGLKKNAEKLRSHAQDLKNAIDTAEAKYNKLATTIGTTAGATVRKFFTGLLG